MVDHAQIDLQQIVGQGSREVREAKQAVIGEDGLEAWIKALILGFLVQVKPYL